MAEILQSKNLATKFQILLQVAANQPNVQQKDIAKKLNITSQAVSEYVRELIKDRWLSSQGRSRYKVTREGVDWILKMDRQLQSYSSFVSKAISDIATCTAIADRNLAIGQSVSLYMKDGLLFASGIISEDGARGVAVSEAAGGEDIGVSKIEGLISLKTGEITIGKVPNVQEGGSRNINRARLEEEVSRARLTGAIGIEALISLKQIDSMPDYFYGVKEAAIEAAYCGLSFLVICVEDSVAELVQRVEEENLGYKTIDLRKK